VIAVRQSTIESFRRVVAGAYGASEADLVAYLANGQECVEETRKMAAGTAWHAVLQDGAPHWCGDNWFACGGFRFHKDAVAFAGHTVGPGLTERPGRMFLKAAGEEVILTGTADHVRGAVIQDHKTKLDEGTPQLDPEPYFDSFQWRAYLLIHDCRVFRYNLWGFKDRGAGELDLVDYLPCRMWAYPAMRRDVTDLVAAFVEWARPNGLLKNLRVKGVVARDR
jgi:hypothetical protein